MNKKIYTTFLMGAGLFFLTACGGGGGGGNAGAGGGSESNDPNLGNNTYTYYWNGDNLKGYRISFKIEKTEGASVPTGYRIVWEFDEKTLEGWNTKNNNKYHPDGYTYRILDRDTDSIKAAIHISYYGGSSWEDYVLTPTSATDGTYTYVGHTGGLSGKSSGTYHIATDGGGPYVAEANATKDGITLKFSEGIDKNSIDKSRFKLTDKDNVINGKDLNISLMSDKRTLLVKPKNDNLKLYHNYSLDIDSWLEDLNGVPAKGPYTVTATVIGHSPIYTEEILAFDADKPTPESVAFFEKGPRLKGKSIFYHSDKNGVVHLQTRNGACYIDVSQPEKPRFIKCEKSEKSYNNFEKILPIPTWDDANNLDYVGTALLKPSLTSRVPFVLNGDLNDNNLIIYNFSYLPEDGRERFQLEGYFGLLGFFGKYMLTTTHNEDVNGNIVSCHLNKIDVTNLWLEKKGERECYRAEPGDKPEDLSEHGRMCYRQPFDSYKIKLVESIPLPKEKCFQRMEVVDGIGYLYNPFRKDPSGKSTIMVTTIDENTTSIININGTLVDLNVSHIKNMVLLNNSMFVHTDYNAVEDLYVYSRNGADLKLLGSRVRDRSDLGKDRFFSKDYHGSFEVQPSSLTHIRDNLYMYNGDVYSFDDPLNPVLLDGIRFSNEGTALAHFYVNGYAYSLRLKYTHDDHNQEIQTYFVDAFDLRDLTAK